MEGQAIQWPNRKLGEKTNNNLQNISEKLQIEQSKPNQKKNGIEHVLLSLKSIVMR